jgi:glycopeptide antibiotics resistance protein
LRTEETDLDGFPETTVKNIFRSSDPYHIVVTYDYKRERIYVNGRKLLEEPSIRGRFSNWNPSYPLLFGNENTGNRPWQGSLFLVAVYKRGLSAAEILRNYKAGRFYRPDEADDDNHLKDGRIALYLFNENGGSVIHDKSGYGLDIDLLIPEKVIIDVQKHFLEVYTPGPQNILDIMQNVFAFTIFGFLLNSFLSTRCNSSTKKVLFGVIIGATFSVGSESIAYFLDTRTSSLLDSLSRFSGVAFGMSIGIYTKYRNEKHKMHISRI